MKKLSLITAGLMAVGLVSSQAQTVVHITGSTAYRANVNNILNGVVNNGGANYVFDSNPTVVGATFSSSASQLCFQGMINSSAVTILTSFTGSEAGVAAISKTDGSGTSIGNPVPADTYDDGSTPVANTPNSAATIPGTPQASYLNASTGTGPLTPAASDIAMTDTSVAVSLTKTAAITDGNAGGAPIGIVQFEWLKGYNSLGTPDAAYGDLVNVTLPQINVLMGAGEQEASFFTGVRSDNVDTVVLIGRNKGSGTRVNVLADQNYGITKPLIQYGIGNFSYDGSGNLVNPSAGPIDASHVAAIGNDGFDSGSGVKASLNLDVTGSGYIPVGYIGLGDAAGVTHVATQHLTLNGVPYSDANIQNGTYTYYGHEHLYFSNGASATAQTVAHKLTSGFSASETGGVSGLALSTLHADRSGDTGYPAPTN